MINLIKCSRCDLLFDENAKLKARCELLEKYKSLANVFQSSNEKVMNMLTMSNKPNCRKGIGSNTCIDKCTCVPIKKCFVIPDVKSKNKHVYKHPHGHKTNDENQAPKRTYARMYHNKYAKPNRNMENAFYVYDKFNRKIKLIKKWIPKGSFNIDNPGGMRLWF